MGSTRNAGFTLIEIMIVVAIVAIIAAIGIPNLLESRKLANEAAAIQALRSVHSAQTLFYERDLDKNGVHDYATAIGMLRSVLPEELFRTEVGKPYNGYDFALLDPQRQVDPEHEWGAVAAPARMGWTGDRSFFIDETGVIRYATVFGVFADVNGDGIPDDINGDGIPDLDPLLTLSDLRAWPPLGGSTPPPASSPTPPPSDTPNAQ